jgi:hypothetical protein
MAGQVITIERKKYAAGLFWQPLASGQNARGLAAARLAKSIPGAVKYFTEYRSMVGIGWRSLGHRRRMPSAAAEVMDAFSDYNSFLAAFAVRQGFYLVAARNGIIIQDKLFADEASARAEYDQLVALPDWGLLVAPAHWSIARAEEKLLSEVVSGDTRYYLAPVSKIGSIIISAVVLIALFAGIFFVFREPLKHTIKPKQRAVEIDESVREAYKRKLEARDAALVSAARITMPAAQPVVMPYDNIPDVSERARQCFEAIAFLMQVIPGWNQTDAECEGDHAAVNLHRRFGIITDVYEFVVDKMPGVEIVENSDSDMALIMELPELPGQSRLAEQDADTVVRNINSIFQLMGHDADVRRSIETVRGAGAMASVNIVLIVATSSLQPQEFVKIFEDYDAVLLSSVRWNAALRKWNYEVKIYVK